MQEDSVARLQKRRVEKVDNGLSSWSGDTIIEWMHGGGGTQKKGRQCWLRVQRLPNPQGVIYRWERWVRVGIIRHHSQKTDYQSGD